MANREGYLHECLRLHGQVTEIRYGSLQELGKLESHVTRMWAAGASMWDVIEAIHDNDAFDASMFGSFDRGVLKSAIDQVQWRELAKYQLIARLFEAFRQIEPVSVALRFIDPIRFGIMSSPVQTVLGIRPQRKPTATYEAYLESLEYIRTRRYFDRIADVEMALWALQVGVLDGMLPKRQREELAKDCEEDVELRRIQAWNLTKQLFETAKLDVADALVTTEPAIAGQIAGIEFERLVMAASLRSREKLQPGLKENIDRLCRSDPRLYSKLDRARRIRNKAIHRPTSIRQADVKCLIAVARDLQSESGI